MKNIRGTKGVTLISLIISVVVLMILTSIVVLVDNPLEDTKAITDFNNDLIKLNEYVDAYYLENNELPVLKDSLNNKILYTDISMLVAGIKNPNDNGNYFIIDLDVLVAENNVRIPLTYGNDGFEEMKEGNTSQDVYIINERTHSIYYPLGLEVDGEIHYSEGLNYSFISLSDIVNKVTMKANVDIIEYAIKGDTVIVTVELKRKLDYGTEVTATIAGRAATVSITDRTVTASLVIPVNESSLPLGEISFSIQGITTSPITSVTEGKKVTYIESI